MRRVATVFQLSFRTSVGHQRDVMIDLVACMFLCQPFTPSLPPLFLHSKLSEQWALEIMNLYSTPRVILCPLSQTPSPRSLTLCAFSGFHWGSATRGRGRGQREGERAGCFFICTHPVGSCSMISFPCPFSPRAGKGFLLVVVFSST